MPPFMYRCSNTGHLVQGLTAEEVSDDDTYQPVTCIMCQQEVHLVNPATGQGFLGEDDNG